MVPLQDVWVDANFKEIQLKDMRSAKPVTVTADIYGGGVVFHGHVLGLGAGSGSAFALLPPQNATGNWIKIVQRVPVRISLDPAELRDHPLRVGFRWSPASISAIRPARPWDRTVAVRKLRGDIGNDGAPEADALIKRILKHERRMSAPGAAGPTPLAGGRLAVTAIALALGTFMQVLDTTIANVSLPTIAGNLGTSTDQGTWEITSFAVGERRRGAADRLADWAASESCAPSSVAVFGFTIASFLCGIAWSLNSLIAFRILQGAISGPMIPGLASAADRDLSGEQAIDGARHLVGHDLGGADRGSDPGRLTSPTTYH